MLIDNPLNRPRRQPFSAVVEKQRLLIDIPFKDKHPCPHIIFKTVFRHPAKRNNPFLFSLSHHPDEPLLETDIFQANSDQLTDTQTGGIEKLQDCPIP